MVIVASSRCWISTERAGVSRCVAAVEMRLERHAVRIELAQLRQRHDLEAAGIGQDRAGPVHEPMQSAESRDALRAGTQHQVIGVAEHDAGARGAHRVGGHRLHRAGGADRHEGRRRAPSPCAVCSTPARAAPSVACMRSRRNVTAPFQQAGIAVGIEAIARLDRVRIGRAHPLGAGEGADQHEQRRARQVEVGQQQIDRAEPVARHDEQRRCRRRTAGCGRRRRRRFPAAAGWWCPPRPRRSRAR